MRAPIVLLCHTLIHVGIRIVDVHAPGRRIFDAIREISNEVLNGCDTFGRIGALVNAVVEEVHKKGVTVGVSGRVRVRLGHGGGGTAVQVDLDVPVALVGLGVGEPVVGEGLELGVVQSIRVETGGVEGFVLDTGQSRHAPMGIRYPKVYSQSRRGVPGQWQCRCQNA